MPLLVRGLAVCDTCGARKTMYATYSNYGSIAMWWRLPKSWYMFERGQNQVHIYCSNATCGPKVYSGSPDQTGIVEDTNLGVFDTKTIDKVMELFEAKSVSANDILNAFEAVLVAWRKGDAT